MQLLTKHGLRMMGHSEAQKLVGLINARDPVFERIEKLVENIIRFDEIARKKRYKKELVKNADIGSMGTEARQLICEINEFYNQVPICLSLDRPTEYGWTTPYSFSDPSTAHLQLGALLVLEAAAQGYIRLIRRCSHCKKWLVIKRKAQRFCSAECREKVFRSSPRGRVKRAKYMRGYRASLKRRDSENLRVVETRKGH